MILLSNVGNRDLELMKSVDLPSPLIFQRPYEDSNKERVTEVSQFSMGPLPQKAMRAMSQYIFENPKLFDGAICFPIIDSIIQYVIEELQEPLEEVVLFVTNQDDEGYRNTDTLYCGKYFKSRYKDVVTSHIKKINALIFEQSSVKVGTPIEYKSNPSDFDSAQLFFQDQLSRQARKNPSSNFVLNITGGTPAMNSMLLLYGTDLLPNPAKLKVMYKSSSLSTPIPLSYGKNVLKRDSIVLMRTMIAASDYQAALNLLEQRQAYFESSFVSLMGNVLKFAQSRSSYDFRAAKAALEQSAGDFTTEEREQFLLWRNELDILKSHASRKERLRELWDNLDLQLMRGEYIGFLGRLFRFCEEILRAIAVNLGVEVNETGYIKSWVEHNPTVKCFLENYRTETGKKKQIDYTRAASRLTYIALIEALTTEDSVVRETLKFLQKVERLADLRNNTILAHDFEGVSLEIMIDVYDQSIQAEDFHVRIMQDLAILYRDTFAEDMPNQRVFAEINRRLIQILETRTQLN